MLPSSYQSSYAVVVLMSTHPSELLDMCMGKSVYLIEASSSKFEQLSKVVATSKMAGCLVAQELGWQCPLQWQMPQTSKKFSCQQFSIIFKSTKVMK